VLTLASVGVTFVTGRNRGEPPVKAAFPGPLCFLGAEVTAEMAGAKIWEAAGVLCLLAFPFPGPTTDGAGALAKATGTSWAWFWFLFFPVWDRTTSAEPVAAKANTKAARAVRESFFKRYTSRIGL
jgi:hypothetical protein